MPEENQEAPVDEQKINPGEKKSRGITFIIINSLALFIIPVAIIVTLVITVLLQPSFYTGILKNGRFITAFVQARNWQTEKKVSEEIERELHLSSFIKELEWKKQRFAEAKKNYDSISRKNEIESLDKQRSELKNIDWENVKEEFPDEDKFDEKRKEELSKLKEQIKAIEDYQDNNSESIKPARKEMDKAEDEYNDALSILEDKKEEAEKINEKYKSSFTNSLYADLDLIERPLSKILNSKLIDGPVRIEIEKALHFLTSYDKQFERRNIFYEHDMDADGQGRLTLKVRLPEFAISLWANDPVTGQKQHILSELLAGEIKKIDDIQNRTMLTTMFKLSDSSLGEYFTNSFLRKFGMSINGGIIHVAIPELKGESGEFTAAAIEFLSWGQYAIFAVIGLLILFGIYLFFSRAERKYKLITIKRFLIYPSIPVLALCGILLWASRYIFACYPGIISDLSARSYASHLSFTAAWHFIIPLSILFGAALICGLIIRKYFLLKRS